MRYTLADCDASHSEEGFVSHEERNKGHDHSVSVIFSAVDQAVREFANRASLLLGVRAGRLSCEGSGVWSREMRSDKATQRYSVTYQGAHLGVRNSNQRSEAHRLRRACATQRIHQTVQGTWHAPLSMLALIYARARRGS